MDRIRENRRHPLVVKALRLLKPGLILIAIVFGIALIPVLVLYFLMDPIPEESSTAFLPPGDVETVFFESEVKLVGDLYLPRGRPPFTGIVLVHGSGRMTRKNLSATARELSDQGFAVLAYDKRGVGDSKGEYSGVGPDNSQRILGQLSRDALAGLLYLKTRREIDPERVGLVGFSQAGWIIPLASSRAPQEVRFTAILSGPTVSVGEEIYYSRLTGDDSGIASELSDEEISRRLSLYDGPRGFDPVPALQALTSPGLWVFGGRDRSIQVPECLAILDRFISQERKPFAYKVYPGGDHGLRDSESGVRLPFLEYVGEWIRQQTD